MNIRRYRTSARTRCMCFETIFMAHERVFRSLSSLNGGSQGEVLLPALRLRCTIYRHTTLMPFSCIASPRSQRTSSVLIDQALRCLKSSYPVHAMAFTSSDVDHSQIDNLYSSAFIPSRFLFRFLCCFSINLRRLGT